MLPRYNIGIISDGIRLTTGFANVARRIAAEMHTRGWRLFQIASLDTPPFCDSAAYAPLGVQPYFPAGGSADPLGMSVAAAVLGKEQPDALLLVCDPATAAGWLALLRSRGFGDIPTVYYGPVEGSPVLPLYGSAFRDATAAFTITRWSSERLREEFGLSVPWVYHGVGENFTPARPGQRQELRRRMGWDDRFVVMYCARNTARKGIDRLIKAAQLAREHVPNLRVYLHTAAHDERTLGGALGGMDLAWLAGCYGVADIIEFAPMRSGDQGVEEYRLADRYRAADLYVSTSTVEGFGLPLAEAMASGLPVVCPADGGNQQEVVGEAALALMEPADWGTWFNGAQLAHVTPEMVASVIVHIATKMDKLPYTKAQQQGIARARAFDWNATCRTIANAVAAVADGKPAATATATR